MKIQALYCVVCLIMTIKKMVNAQHIIVNVVYTLIPQDVSIRWYLGNNEFACKMRSSCIVKFSKYKFELLLLYC